MTPPKRSISSPATRFIILFNIAIFLAWITASTRGLGFLADNFLVSWDALAEGRYWVLITSVFSHNALLHLFINMFVLNSFGPIVEKVLGMKRYLIFYFVAGVLSSLSHALLSNYLLHQPALPALGASGAISGLILLFALLFPKQKILLLGIIPLPALMGAALAVGLDLWGLQAQAAGGGLPIGHGAHLGGALTGLLFYFIFLRRKWLSLLERVERKSYD